MNGRSSALAATVLIPTHSHGPLLLHAIRSVLGQTLREFEVFVVGDGVDDATRAVGQEAARLDGRVQFFDLPKGPRHGELHRHAVLREARGEIICYLCDDDLFLPSHLEYMQALLRDADFAHAAPLYIEPGGRVCLFCGHLDESGVKDRLGGLWNFIPLSCAAHTREFYERLPYGWRTAPPDVWTDLWMWRQILTTEGCRAQSGMRPTVIHFPTPARADWSLEQRERELASWAARITEPGLEAELACGALDTMMRANYRQEQHLGAAAAELRALREAAVARAETLDEAVHAGLRIPELERQLSAVHEAHGACQSALAKSEAELTACNSRSHELEAQLTRCEDDLRRTTMEMDETRRHSAMEIDERDRHIAELSREINAIKATITWRCRQRLIRRPLLATAIRTVAKLVSRRPAR